MQEFSKRISMKVLNRLGKHYEPKKKQEAKIEKKVEKAVLQRVVKRPQKQRNPRMEGPTVLLRRHMKQKYSLTGTMTPMGALTSYGAGISGYGGTGPVASLTNPALLPADVAAKAVERLVLNPFAENLFARWTDSFSLIPTCVAKDLIHQPLPIFQTNLSSGSADRGSAIFLHGDPHQAAYIPSSVDSSTSSTTKGQITWPSGNWYSMQAAVPAYVQMRPVGMGHRFTYSAVGPYHTIVARVIEFGPELPPAWTSPTPWTTYGVPEYLQNGATFNQRQFLRAREFVLEPGSTTTITLLPCNASSLNYVLWDEPRYYVVGARYQIMSWSDACIWFFGLEPNDTIYWDGVAHHEYYHSSTDISGTQQPQAAAITMPSAAANDKALSTVAEASVSGWTVFKNSVSEVADVVKKAVPYVSSLFGALGLVPKPLEPGNLNPHSWFQTVNVHGAYRNPLTCIKTEEGVESKDPLPSPKQFREEVKQLAADIEDMPVVLTPKGARRPSIAKSLTAKTK